MSGRDTAIGVAQRGYWFGLQWLWRFRREWFVLRLKATAILRHATLDLDVARDVMLSRGVRVDVEPGSTNRLAVGSLTRLQEGVLLWLRGGTIEIGARCAIRRDVRMNSSGRLTVGDDVLLSYGLVVHCADVVSIADKTIVGEYSTITDSAHRRTVEEPVWHHVKPSPTHIGTNVWIGAASVVASGVTVGDRAFVASHSVVTKDVPVQWLVAGAPAKPVRELDPERG